MLDVVLNTLLHEGEGRGMRAAMPELNAVNQKWKIYRINNIFANFENTTKTMK